MGSRKTADSKIATSLPRNSEASFARGAQVIGCPFLTPFSFLDDAPRGLVWSFNILIAPLLGAGIIVLTRSVVHPLSVFKTKEKHNNELNPTNEPAAGGPI
jgi:hypothetical protein